MKEFKGPLQPKKEEKKKAPWDFRMPEYDERTSCYVNTGSHYGSGKRQPVGHSSGASLNSSALPSGAATKVLEDVSYRRNLDVEVQQ
jgi:hypothetical protein